MRESVDPKGVRLKHKILQSPMAGCTDLAYRKIARRFGCQIAFTEMVKDKPVVQGNPKTLDMLQTADWDHPLGMQVVGRDPELMGEAARRLEALGADVIDVNLGCPVPKVVNDGCGAALLKEPEQVGPHPRRHGLFGEGARNDQDAHRIRGRGRRPLPGNREAGRRVAGAGAITVHGRTRKQMYTGFSNHEAIRAVKEVARVPVIGNGDIHSGADAKKMIEDTGCDGVMLARGALGNPWIYKEVEQYLETGTLPAPPTVAEKAAVLRDQFPGGCGRSTGTGSRRTSSGG